MWDGMNAGRRESDWGAGEGLLLQAKRLYRRNLEVTLRFLSFADGTEGDYVGKRSITVEPELCTGHPFS